MFQCIFGIFEKLQRKFVVRNVTYSSSACGRARAVRILTEFFNLLHGIEKEEDELSLTLTSIQFLVGNLRKSGMCRLIETKVSLTFCSARALSRSSGEYAGLDTMRSCWSTCTTCARSPWISYTQFISVRLQPT